MAFNKYGVYSALSQTESNNNKEYEECIKNIEKLDMISSKVEAEAFIKETWNYINFSQKKVIAKDCVLSVVDSASNFVINFDCLNDHYIYSYKK